MLLSRTILHPAPIVLRSAFPLATFPHFRSSMSSAASSHPNPWAEELPKPAAEMGLYLATLPDFAKSKRMSVRPVHLAHAAVGHETGWIGATFGNDPVADGQPPQMTGSWMLIREMSIAKALERLGRDIYAAGGAWDMSQATISAVAMAKH